MDSSTKRRGHGQRVGEDEVDAAEGACEFLLGLEAKPSPTWSYWNILPCQPLERGGSSQGPKGPAHHSHQGSRMDPMATADDLLSDALRLPPEERARLAHELLLSLEAEGEDSDAEAEWAGELERRAQEVIGGKVKLVSPEEARRQVAEHLERIRRER